MGSTSQEEVEEWVTEVDEVSSQIRGIIDGTITDFDEFDRKLDIKGRAKEIRTEESREKREKFFLNGISGKGVGDKYKWWCKRCFVEYYIELPGNTCTRCRQSDMMMTQGARREELMGKLEGFKEDKAKHSWRKDKWRRWKKSQALLGRSRNINYRAWEYWEPDTASEEEGDPIVPRDNPEFLAMEADMKKRRHQQSEKAKTAHACQKRGNQCMKEGDYHGAIEHYEEGLEYKRDLKALWTNKALAEVKVFRWHDAISSCNKVIEYSEIFEDGFTNSADACFKAFTRRAAALRALHKWGDALRDLEDALKLFPKDREAQDLYKKTQQAHEEASRVEQLQQSPQQEEPEEPPRPPEAPKPPPAVGPGGAVRVEIEESDEEDGGEEAVPDVAPSSLAALSKQQFDALVARLTGKQSERVLFCARQGGQTNQGSDRADTRKIKLKVEEVAEPSGLDGVLRDAERCCVLWKKSQGHVVPLRSDVQVLAEAESQKVQDRKDAAFLQVAAPRLVAVLYVLANSSDHHCALTAPAVKHVWPLLASKAWRHAVLKLLMEWSQRSISSRSMAEFASRYPDPHLRILIDTITQEAKENALPPELEELAGRAARRAERGESGLDDALDEMMRGLMAQTPLELALSALGNLCLVGVSVPGFKEQMAPFREALVGALGNHLKAPLNWRLRGRTAGAICNVVRLGGEYAAAVHERCVDPLVNALREECKPDSTSSFVHMLREQCAAPSAGGGPLPYAGARARLLAALVNLLVVRPAATQQMLGLGVLDMLVPLIDPEADAVADGAADDGDGDPATVALRAAQLGSRLLIGAPASLSLPLEADLLRRIFRMLERCGDFAAVRAAAGGAAAEGSGAEASPSFEQLDLALRMLSVLIVKTPGGLDRLLEKMPRVEELPDGARAPPAAAGPAVPFGGLVQRLAALLRALQPRAHAAPDDEGSTLSRMRGNLAVLFSRLSDEQAREDAAPALREADFSPLVSAFMDCLRKERGAVQQNIGVCVTRLAHNPRYRQQVRDLNGIESLHQIQLPKVEAEKAEAARQHRLETSAEARKAEAQRLRRLRDLRELD